MAKFNAKEAFQKAQDFGEVFLGSLSKEDLEKTGFDSSTFGSFEYADVYLQWYDDEFVIKYVFDGDPRQAYYEKVRDVGKDTFALIIDEYIARLGGE
jgi:hypothetical protein